MHNGRRGEPAARDTREPHVAYGDLRAFRLRDDHPERKPRPHKDACNPTVVTCDAHGRIFRILQDRRIGKDSATIEPVERAPPVAVACIDDDRLAMGAGSIGAVAAELPVTLKAQGRSA